MPKDSFKIIAETKYIALNGGFWGFVDESGNSWRCGNMPNALKQANLKVELIAELADYQFSIFMWGTEIDIIDYKIFQ